MSELPSILFLSLICFLFPSPSRNVSLNRSLCLLLLCPIFYHNTHATFLFSFSQSGFNSSPLLLPLFTLPASPFTHCPILILSSLILLQFLIPSNLFASV
ncbi:hypothetical protein HOY82DRAFT_571966 [Tuber indicum]|nr:hypothetical protein HOY82DRAFT_571966 [Tuber indicum]